MARERKREEIAKDVLAKYVSDVQFVSGVLGHKIMNLIYSNGHQMTVLQTKDWERKQAGKLPNQAYSIQVRNPKGEQVSKNSFLTAKMVKLAIMKTKALDMLKGVNKWA